jgi:CheY-like chemotaxis protein
VVEDNDDNRLLLRALFAERYDLHEYSDGPEAIAGFANHIPDVILLDVSLPGMDGFEVLRTIRADERLRELPVVALTAHVMAGDRERILAAGFNEYVSKPIVDEEVLFKAVERLLGQSSSSNG